MTSISRLYSSISRSYLFISCLNDVYRFKYPLLRGKKFLYEQNINKICTDINDINRYEQICVCPYQLIFLQFI